MQILDFKQILTITLNTLFIFDKVFRVAVKIRPESRSKNYLYMLCDLHYLVTLHSLKNYLAEDALAPPSTSTPAEKNDDYL